MLRTLVAVAGCAAVVLGHGDHEDQTPIAGPHKSLWYNTLPGDGGTQVGFPTSVSS
jgi:agmatinase